MLKISCMYLQRNIEVRCCSGKAISIPYSECVFVALGTQHAMRVRHIVICCVSALQYFSTLSHRKHDFRKKKVTEH